MRECAELDINHVWMHRAFGAGSLSPAAADYGRAHCIKVIDGACPLMFPPAADVGHRVMRVMLTLKGNVPKTVRPSAAAPSGARATAHPTGP